MQNLLEMGVKSHEAWLKSEFYNICVFQYAYALLTFDLDLVFESHTVQASSYVSADVGKTIDRVLATHLLQTVIKLTLVANFGFIH